MTDGTAITVDGTATTDGEGITADAMTGITIGVMFVMTTGGTITNRRFDRISKTFAMHAMKSDKAAGSYVGIIRN
jgi:hypothetical protein